MRHLIVGGVIVSHRLHSLRIGILIATLFVIFFSMTSCKRTSISESETIRIFSLLIPENFLFYSEDGGIWCLDHMVRGADGEAEQVVAQRYGPVFLPETEDVGKTLQLHITGIHRSDNMKFPDWWFLDYFYEKADNKPKTLSLSLQLSLNGQWYVLPVGGSIPSFVPWEPNSINLMKGRLYPEEAELIVPGHYRLVLLRDWRGEVALDVEEFDLVETVDGYAINNIHKPADLNAEEAYVPEKIIQREDGSHWRLAEASRLEWWDFQPDTPRTDTLEALGT